MRKPSAEKITKREKTVRGLLYSINVEVDHLPNTALRKIAPHLVEIERQLSRDLQRYLSSVKDGSEKFTAQQMRRALVQLRGTLEHIEKTRPQLRGLLQASGVAASALAQRHLEKEFALFSIKFGDTINPIPIIQAAQIAQRSLLDRYSKISTRWDKNSLTIIKSELSKGLLKGETIDQMTRRLLGPVGRRRFGLDATPAQLSHAIGEKMGKRIAYEARRIVRTEVINAYNVNKLSMITKLARKDKELTVRWDAALDGRMCSACGSLDHVVIPVGGTFRGGIKSPPLHPNCRCAIVAYSKGWDEAGDVKHEDGNAPLNEVRYDRPTRSLKSS